MSEINSFNNYASRYNTNMDYSMLFCGGAPYIENGMGGVNVFDYAMIKNGSYGKLVKAYCTKQEALSDASLYEKKKFKKKDEKTGEKTEVCAAQGRVDDEHNGKSGIETDNMFALKSLFMGYGSFADKIAQKSSAISNAVERTKGVDKL